MLNNVSWFQIIYVTVIIIITIVVSQAIGSTYEWVDSSGTVNFSDDPSKVPAKYRIKVESEEKKLSAPSWVMIVENISGYIYRSYGFYDENGVKKRSSNEWLVPVKMIIDDSRRRGVTTKSYTQQIYRLICSPRSASVIENEEINTDSDQIPNNYTRLQMGAAYHESLIPYQLLDLFCGITPESFDYTKPGNLPFSGRR